MIVVFGYEEVIGEFDKEGLIFKVVEEIVDY